MEGLGRKKYMHFKFFKEKAGPKTSIITSLGDVTLPFSPFKFPVTAHTKLVNEGLGMGTAA